MGAENSTAPPSIVAAGLGRRQMSVLSWLVIAPMTTRELADADCIPFGQMNDAVLRLEARGFIRQENGRWFR